MLLRISNVAALLGIQLKKFRMAMQWAKVCRGEMSKAKGTRRRRTMAMS